MRKKMDKVRLAIIGCGGMAGAHLNAYIGLKRDGIDIFDFVAMCDVDENRANSFAARAAEVQEGHAPKVYTDIEEMLSQETLNAADICGPHFLHHSLAITCFEAGLDVIVEKPLAVTVRAGHKMIESAASNRRILATAEQVRRWVSSRTVNWLINTENRIGQPRMFFRQGIGGSQDPENRLRDEAMVWRRNKLLSGGNGIIDGGVHYIDLLIYFFGEPDEIYARSENLNQYQFKDRDGNFVPQTVEDTALTTITFKNGVIGQFVSTNAAPGRGMSYNSYHGSLGSIYSGGGYPESPELQLWDGTKQEKDSLINAYMESLSDADKERFFPHGITEGVMLEVYDFLDAVRNRRPPELDGVDGLKAQAVCDAIYESGWCSQAVKFDDVYNDRITGYQDEINERWGI
jgi:UDP-N-acetyl-2-amino-2-deoxyglucuronate dehydrogenase